jgi:hypothetical protein
MVMESKAPAVLVVLVEAAKLCWFVAGLGLDGAVSPLLRSEEGDLSPYQGLDFDEQVSFLRHRFCGVLQRGCDRLWARDRKACQFVFVFGGLLPGTTARLTEQVAEHFVLWMLNPPVAVFACEGGLSSCQTPPTPLAGQLDAPLLELLVTHLAGLIAETANESAWELSAKRASTWTPECGS